MRIFVVIRSESKIISRPVRAQARPTSKQFLIMVVVSRMKKRRGFFCVENWEET